MPQYTISVQGNVYKTITTSDGVNFATVTDIINADLASGNLTVDSALPLNIAVTPVAGS